MMLNNTLQRQFPKDSLITPNRSTHVLLSNAETVLFVYFIIILSSVPFFFFFSLLRARAAYIGDVRPTPRGGELSA